MKITSRAVSGMILAAIAIAGAIFFRSAWQDRQRDREFKASMAEHNAAWAEDTRAHAMSIAQWNARSRFKAPTLLALLAKLPPLDDLAPDGLRFAAMPSTGRRYFAIALAHRAGSVTGTILRVDLDEDWQMGPNVVTRTFPMPVPAYLAMSARAERLFDGWKGYGPMFDGSDMALERIHDGRVMSGAGTIGPYAKLALLMRHSLAPFVPGIGRLEADWSAYPPGHEPLPPRSEAVPFVVCSEPDFTFRTPVFSKFCGDR